MNECANCKTENRHGAKFCDNCGQSLAAPICKHCQAELRPEAKFCDQCGNPAAGKSQAAPRDYTPRHLAEHILTNRGAMAGERKTVTILFADIAHSMELAAQVDPETWHGILDRFFSILSDEIHRVEGSINQYTGDGVMALFGAPIAHEDHAQRACLAALALRKRLRDFGDEIRLNQGLNFAVRMGLNSGEVVVGAIGDDLRMDYTAQGHSVGLAARMEAIAEPGQAWLTEHTAKLVQGYFELHDLGRIRIKGIDEPPQVFRLKGRGQHSTRLERSTARGLSPFVGRDDEFAALGSALAAVKDGESRTVLISGDGGIGKSRLCAEFLQTCRDAGLGIDRCSALPYGHAMPFLPVQELMRCHFGIDERDSPAAARRKIAGELVLNHAGSVHCAALVADFLNLADPNKPSSEVPPEKRQERLRQLFSQMLPGHSEPRVVMLEDLHWLDSGSSEFFAELRDAIDSAPTLLLVNSRPADIPHWLRPQLILDLAPLTDEALRNLTQSLLGSDNALSDLAQRVHARSGGSPFYVEEMILSLVESGHLSGQRGAYQQQRKVHDLRIPDSVQAIIAGRIDRLDASDKSLLQTAAVIGSEFTSGLLGAVSQHEPKALQQALERLEAGQFINRCDASCEDDSEYHFAHPVTQEVAYHGQLRDARQRLHAQLAAVLEEQIVDDDYPGQISLRLAHHWEHAGDTLRAGKRQHQAGFWVSSQSMEQGLIRYRRAVELLGDATNAEAAKWSVAARAAIIRIAQFVRVPAAEVEAHYHQATALARRHDNHRGLVQLMISYGSEQVQRGEPQRAVSLMREALGMARQRRDYPAEAQLRLPILAAWLNAGLLEEGLTILQEEDGSVWGYGPITAENFQSRGLRALILMQTGRLDECAEQLKACMACAAEQGTTVSWMHANLAELSWYNGIAGNTQQEARRAVELAEEYGSQFFRSLAWRALAQAESLAGNHQTAVDILRQHRAGTAAGEPGHQYEGIYLAHLGECLLATGDLEGAKRTSAEAMHSVQRSSTRGYACRARLLRLRIMLTAGATDEDWNAEVAALQADIAATNAGCYAPFLQELQAQRSSDKIALRAAAEAFAVIGAHGHADRILNLAR